MYKLYTTVHVLNHYGEVHVVSSSEYIMLA